MVKEICGLIFLAKALHRERFNTVRRILPAWIGSIQGDNGCSQTADLVVTTEASCTRTKAAIETKPLSTPR